MASSSLANIQKKYASMQVSQRMARVKKRGDELAHTLMASGAAYAMGVIERNATNPLPTVFGLDPKLSWGALFALLSSVVGGKVGAACSSTADGLLTSYGYAQGLGQGYTLKGEPDDGDDF